MSTDYEIGFCKPPKATQFKKGQSGNLKGRPKQAKAFGQQQNKSFAADVLKALLQTVTIKEGWKSKKSTKQQLIVKSIFAQANKNPKFAAIALGLIHQYGSEDSADPASITYTISSEQVKKLQAWVDEPDHFAPADDGALQITRS